MRNGHDIRAKFEIAVDAPLFIVIGQLNPFKRFEEICRAFAIAVAVNPKLILAVAGSSEDPNMIRMFEDAVAKYNLGNHVKLLGYLNHEDFHGLIHTSEAGINLRWPTLGEASYTLTQLMGAGKPVLITDHCQFSEYPCTASWKIPVGKSEPQHIANALLTLAGHPEYGRAIGRNARKYIEQFSWDRVAGKCVEFIDSLKCDA